MRAPKDQVGLWLTTLGTAGMLRGRKESTELGQKDCGMVQNQTPKSPVRNGGEVGACVNVCGGVWCAQ